jgi:hypothetical protein
LYCRAIARELGRDQPFFAITPCGLDGENAPGTFEEMADRHLQALREVQPHGPYFLGGTCNGGLIALEMARRLAQSGEAVERLIVIRSSARNVRYAILRNLAERWGPVLGVSVQRRREFVRFCMDHFVPHIRWFEDAWVSKSPLERLALTLEKAGKALSLLWQTLLLRRPPRSEPGSRTLQPEHPAERVSLRATFLRAEAGYVPLPYPGSVLVLWHEADQDPLDQVMRWWRKVSPQAKIEITPGDHLTALTLHAKILAKHIATDLATYAS